MLEHIILQMEEERCLDRSAAIADMRFSFIEKLCDAAVIKPKESKEHKRSRHIDKILTGKYTVAFEAEGGRSPVPVVAEELAETVVVEMYLQRIHLVVGHDLHQIFDITHGEELAAYIEHESAHGVAGYIYSDSARDVVAILFKELQESASAPEYAASGGACEYDAIRSEERRVG